MGYTVKYQGEEIGNCGVIRFESTRMEGSPMTFADYHKSEGVSNTMLGHLERSPAHLQAYLTQDKVSTRAQRFGSMFHALMQHDKLPDCYAVRPEGMDGRTKEGKAWKAEMASSGKLEVSNDDAIAAHSMRASIMRNPRLRLAIETGQREQPLYADFSLGGTVRRKGLLDLITCAAAILDFKTTTDASPEAFRKCLVKLGYARQAAYYLDLAKENGLPQDKFGFVAVEKEPPYAVAIYQVSESAIQWGRGRYTDLLTKYIECRDAGQWPAYGDEPMQLDLPKWAA